MPPAISKLMEQIDSRILRERVLIFLTLLAVVFLFWQLLVQSHIDDERKRLQTESDKLTKEQREVETKIATLTQAMASDPAIPKKKMMSDLQATISEVEARLSGLSQGLISADQLPKVLQEVLARTATINLLQVRTLPAAELRLATAVVSAEQTGNKSEVKSGLKQSGTGVYKHGVLIRVSGSYSQLLKLLQEIEALEWKFYWESLNYTVKNYPNAEIEIQVFTLSSDEGLLGV